MTWDGRSSTLLDLGDLASATSPHQVTDQSWYRSGSVIMCSLTITLGASLGAGNIANTELATIASFLPPVNAVGANNAAGPMFSAYLSVGGSIGIAATADAIASGTVISIGFCYLAVTQ